MSKWNDLFLNEMRLKGDPLADKAADALFDDQHSDQVFKELHRLALNKSLIPEDFPSDLKEYFRESEKVIMTPEDIEKTELATDLFNRYGFRICALLFFKSLPTGYQCARPAHVLGTTKLLIQHPARRVFETSQFVFDVCKANWYKPDGEGIRSTQRVRLFHAGMRHMILKDAERQWDKNILGVPINQEDMVLTLQLFSLACIAGLRLMGVRLTNDEEEAYFHHWKKIGQVLGVDPQLEPKNVSDGWDLQKSILKRQLVLPNQDGPPLTAALLGIVNESTKGVIKMHTLDKITQYFIHTTDSYKYLGLSKPSFIDLVIDKFIHLLLNMDIFHHFHHDSAKEEEPRFLPKMFRNILIKRFNLDPETARDLKTDLMEHISKGMLISMTRDAVAQSEFNAQNTKDHKSIYIEDKLIEEWQLGGFAFDAADQM